MIKCLPFEIEVDTGFLSMHSLQGKKDIKAINQFNSSSKPFIFRTRNKRKRRNRIGNNKSHHTIKTRAAERRRKRRMRKKRKQGRNRKPNAKRIHPHKQTKKTNKNCHISHKSQSLKKKTPIFQFPQNAE
jgi:hypothetical protein